MKRFALAALHDYGKTTKWYRRAANWVYTNAQFNRGQNLLWKNLKKSDPLKLVQAEMCMRRAAERGHVMAQCGLGEMYEVGNGVEVDYAEALKWYHKAAEQGSAMGQFALGKMYEIGRGVPQDHLHAHMWFSLAAAQYSNTKRKVNAAVRREFVAERMTPAQIAEAQRLAREWEPKTE